MVTSGAAIAIRYTGVTARPAGNRTVGITRTDSPEGRQVITQTGRFPLGNRCLGNRKAGHRQQGNTEYREEVFSHCLVHRADHLIVLTTDRLFVENRTLPAPCVFISLWNVEAYICFVSFLIKLRAMPV